MLQSSLTKSLRLYSTKAARNRQALERIIRVDHAGELGADRIYAGQMAVLGMCYFDITVRCIFILSITNIPFILQQSPFSAPPSLHTTRHFFTIG